MNGDMVKTIARLAFMVALGLGLWGTNGSLAGNVIYQYDDLGRLTEALYDDGTRITYGYDAVGNRISRVITAGAPSNADLGIAITDAPDPVTQGNSITYGVTVTNNGPDGATGASLAATLPAGVTLVSATPSQGTCDGVVNCTLGAMASLATATVTIVVTADSAGTVNYPMSVAAAEADPVTTNNSATATTTVNAPPVETWYLRDTAGAACGAGGRKAQSETAGSSSGVSLDVEGSAGETWNRTEITRSIPAGDWSVILDVVVGSGGGPPNRVGVTLTRRNSTCVTQQPIISDATVNLTKGALNEDVLVTAVGVPQVDFTSGDILVLELSDANGKQTKFVQYDNVAGSGQDSRINHPGSP